MCLSHDSIPDLSNAHVERCLYFDRVSSRKKMSLSLVSVWYKIANHRPDGKGNTVITAIYTQKSPIVSLETHTKSMRNLRL